MVNQRTIRKPGIPIAQRVKARQLHYKRDARRAAELRELRKAVGKRKLKQIRDKLKTKRLAKSKKSKKSKKVKKTKKTQRGGGCNVSTVDVPGFTVGPLSYSSADPAIEGINVAPRRGAVHKNCTNGGKGPNHAMTGGGGQK